MSFKNIAGQKHAIQLIQADLESDRIADSYLFVGPPGSGKRKTALELAKALNCKKEGTGDLGLAIGDSQSQSGTSLEFEDPCDICSSCKKVDDVKHPDVFVLDFESQAQLLDLKDDDRSKQKEIRIDAVRILMSRSLISPLEGKKKVFIIDGAEFLNAESANALLKVLEESSKRSRWILLSVSSERVIPTIRSRCRKVAFAPVLTQTQESQSRPSGTSADYSSQVLNLLIQRKSCKPRETLKMASLILSEKKKGNQRKLAEEFLKDLALKTSELLNQTADIETAEKLSRILQSQDELKRNVSPQLVLDSLLLSF